MSAAALLQNRCECCTVCVPWPRVLYARYIGPNFWACPYCLEGENGEYGVPFSLVWDNFVGRYCHVVSTSYGAYMYTIFLEWTGAYWKMNTNYVNDFSYLLFSGTAGCVNALKSFDVIRDMCWEMEGIELSHRPYN